MNTTEYYKFTCEAGDDPASAELLIFDAIGNWEDIGEVSAKGFARDLAALPKSIRRIDLHINSPGGSLFDASAIYSRLADHPSQKHVYIDGLAASAASIVAMVGHKIFMRANATMMMHLPQGISLGNADDMRKMAGALDTVTESMINIYSKRTALPRDEIRNLLAAETWFSPQQAVEKGFADEVRGVVKAAASLGDQKYIFNGSTFDLSRFRRIPAFATNNQTEGKENMATQPKPPKEDETPTPPAGSAPETATDGKPPKPAPAPPPEPPPNVAAAPPPIAAATESDLDRGVRQERERVTALQALDRPATHAIIEAAIKDGKSVADVTAACIDAMDKAGKQSARRQDASVLNTVRGSDSGLMNDDGDDEDFGALLTRKVKAGLKARGQRALNSRN
jgi:ATP-dependent protease ClpP protease subunit